MKTIYNFLVLGLIACVLSTQVGCAAFNGELPKILAYVQDGNLVLQTIQSFISMYFVSHPNAELQSEVAAAMTKAETALDAALRITQGTQDITSDQVTTAFAPFLAAYNDLLTLVKPLGVTIDTTLTTAVRDGNQLHVPSPLVAAKGK